MKLIRPQKISDQVLSVLEERIAEGVYEEGGKIPPERVLAEEPVKSWKQGRETVIMFLSNRNRIF